MNKRLFIAADVSEKTRSLIRAIQSEFHFYKNNIRFVGPQNVHLTLKFLGDVSDQDIPVIMERIETTVSSFQKFEYICEGTGVFPNPRRPRVLWLGITSGSEYLKKLSSLLNRALQDMPVKPENREYRSHITIGRVNRHLNRPVNLADFLKYRYGKVENPVPDIQLYESILRPKGAIYNSLKSFKLE